MGTQTVLSYFWLAHFSHQLCFHFQLELTRIILTLKNCDVATTFCVFKACNLLQIFVIVVNLSF